jgi:hypothetical protein
MTLLGISKGNVVPVHAKKAYRGVGVTFRSFLTSSLAGSEWLTSRPDRFTPRKQPRSPFNRRLGGSQSWSGCFGEKSFASTGIRTPDRPARSLFLKINSSHWIQITRQNRFDLFRVKVLILCACIARLAERLTRLVRRNWHLADTLWH